MPRIVGTFFRGPRVIVAMGVIPHITATVLWEGLRYERFLTQWEGRRPFGFSRARGRRLRRRLEQR